MKAEAITAKAVALCFNMMFSFKTSF